MGKLQVVTGGQFGSEAKGSVCAHLLRQNRRVVADNGMWGTTDQRVLGMRVGGPNAGHTVYSDDGIEFKFRHVPVAAIADPQAELALAAGSEIDYSVLLDELERVAMYRSARASLGSGDHWPTVHVDHQATVITDAHKAAETEMTGRLGSTAKGIGAARAERIWRRASLYGEQFGRWANARYSYDHQVMGQTRPPTDDLKVDTTKLAYEVLADGGLVQIEGIQGYGLGLHAGYYPFCTSSDCRAVDFMSMAGLSPWDPRVTNDIGDGPEVWVVLRTRPIRVAGNSGPLRDEVTWDQIGLPEERTTVTNKVRRVGGWDPELAAAAIETNGGSNCKVAVTMLDQLFPQDRGCSDLSPEGKSGPGEMGLSDEALDWIEAREKELGIQISMVTTSPTTYITR